MRPVQFYEHFLTMMNVSAMFHLERSAERPALVRFVVQRALVLMSHEHSLLRHVVGKDEAGVAIFAEIDGESLFSEDYFLSFEDHGDEKSPVSAELSKQLVVECKKPCDITKHLFSLKVCKYANEYVFYFIVNHGVTDGPSFFHIVNSFLESLATVDDNMSAEDFDKLLATKTVAPLRDLLNEVLHNPKCSDSNRDFLDASYALNRATDMVVHPPLTKENADFENGGCINAEFHEFSEAVTANILSQCKANNVSFQSLLTTVASLSFFKLCLSEAHDEAEKQRIMSLPIYHFCMVNMRRYLDSSAKTITGVMAGNLWMRQEPYGALDALNNELFWCGLVKSVYSDIIQCLDSSIHFQWLKEMNSGNFRTPHSLIASSMGVVDLKPQYGKSIKLLDIKFEAGMYVSWLPRPLDSIAGLSSDEGSTTMDTAEEGTTENINTTLLKTVATPVPEGRDGHTMIHAYTVLNKLRLTFTWFAYKRDFACRYNDDVTHMLEVIGATVDSGAAELCVKDMITF